MSKFNSMNQKDKVNFIHKEAVDKRPKNLVMSDTQWKFLVRNTITGRNIMMVGPAGCGKTKAATDVAEALGRELFYFNLGATQDPRASLIGNTGFKDNETTFGESAFIRAIQTPNAVVLLDEFSRAHPEAHNILMTVLDYKQRYLRIDEKPDSPIVRVAEGVSFVATANIGTEYSATRAIDRAMWDRFMKVTMDLLDQEQEFDLLKLMFPKVSDGNLTALSTIAAQSRQSYMDVEGELSDMISTRTSVEAADLMQDGFSLKEVADVLYYPSFHDDELVFVKGLVQKFLDTTDEELYNDLDSDEEVPEF